MTLWIWTISTRLSRVRIELWLVICIADRLGCQPPSLAASGLQQLRQHLIQSLSVRNASRISVFAGFGAFVRNAIDGKRAGVVGPKRCCTGCYTRNMPTRHPRHSITETPPVREALDSLRRRGERVKLDDLVIRGARDRLRELEVGQGEEAEKAELRRELIEQLRTGDGLDADAAYEVREHGWTH